MKAEAVNFPQIPFGKVFRRLADGGTTILRAMELEVLELIRLKITGPWVDLGAGKTLSIEYESIDHANADLTLCDIDSEQTDIMAVDLEGPLPFEDKSFDGVILSHVLQYIYNQEQLFSEIGRISRDAAIIITPYSLNYAPEVSVDYLRFREDYLRKSLETADFRPEIFAIAKGPFTLAVTAVEPLLIKVNLFRRMIFAVGWALDSLLMRAAHRTRHALRKRACLGYVSIGYRARPGAVDYLRSGTE
ncbi:MAG: class I SAM-dependent methyltransferase [Sphingomonadales bacterium]|nr:class I SAM-dependent methyltransferase [Sphingomonadales bacterium]